MNYKNLLASFMMLLILVSPVSAATTLQAAFTANPTSGNAPLVVLFTDKSTGNPSVYMWNFGDGGTSRNPSPAHTYLSKGTYTVTLTVTKGTSSSSTSQTITVPGTDPATQHPRAHFSAVKTSGSAPFCVQFIDKSTGSPTAWLWTFGDGTQSREQNPTHQYINAGTYTVSLQVWNSMGACSERFVDYITVK
jgi:PKD repeat protein